MFIKCALVKHLYITNITAYIVTVGRNIIMIWVKMLKQIKHRVQNPRRVTKPKSIASTHARIIV